jgi:hypothetical protein
MGLEKRSGTADQYRDVARLRTVHTAGHGAHQRVNAVLGGVMEQCFIEGRAKYGGAAWSSMIVKLLEDSVGMPLRSPGFPARLGPGVA